MLKLDEKAIKSMHSRATLRRFLELVKDGNADKVSKMCAKGLDPNFHCQESGGESLSERGISISVWSENSLSGSVTQLTRAGL